MIYYNPIYGIFNEEKMQEQMRQQQLQQFHNEQMLKTYDCAHKLQEFLESADKVSPQYQDIAALQCCSVLGEYFMKQNMQVPYDIAHQQMLL